jgi:hypothetical protein
MKQSSRPHSGPARHPSSDLVLPVTGGGTIFHQGSGPGPGSAHPPAATRHRVCRMADPLTLIRPGHPACAPLATLPGRPSWPARSRRSRLTWGADCGHLAGGRGRECRYGSRGQVTRPGARPGKRPTASAPGQVSIRRAVPLNGSRERAKAPGVGNGPGPGSCQTRGPPDGYARRHGRPGQASPHPCRRLMAPPWGADGCSSPWRPCGCKA